MSEACATLESIMELLPPERKQRFGVLLAKFKTIPEDDEYLQILEAIGFMTLLWQEVPERIEQIIKKASPQEQNHGAFVEIIEQAALKALPTFKDLQLLLQRLEEIELGNLQPATALKHHQRKGTGIAIGLALVIGVAIGLLIQQWL